MRENRVKASLSKAAAPIGNRGIEIVASGRANWSVGLQLVDAPVKDVTMRNTTRIFVEFETDVLRVIEAESRPCSLLSTARSSLRLAPRRSSVHTDRRQRSTAPRWRAGRLDCLDGAVRQPQRAGQECRRHG